LTEVPHSLTVLVRELAAPWAKCLLACCSIRPVVSCSIPHGRGVLALSELYLEELDLMVLERSLFSLPFCPFC
jgi:hypothetical protein